MPLRDPYDEALERAVCLRNARIRAYWLIGVPVHGGWEIPKEDVVSRLPWVHLVLSCEACGAQAERYTVIFDPGQATLFLASEHRVLFDLQCDHLKSIAAFQDTDDVKALIPFALLETGGAP